MEFKVKQDTYNPLLKRKELSLDVEHENAGSPSRTSLRDAVAAKYDTKAENVFVVGIETRTGTQYSTCEVQVYDDAETAKRVVAKHIQIRNLPSEERKKIKEQSKKIEEKPKAAEKAKPEKTEAKPEKAETKPPATKEEKSKPEVKPAAKEETKK
jgi:small subunit ribosomal protein S24e